MSPGEGPAVGGLWTLLRKAHRSGNIRDSKGWLLREGPIGVGSPGSLCREEGEVEGAGAACGSGAQRSHEAT